MLQERQERIVRTIFLSEQAKTGSAVHLEGWPYIRVCIVHVR